MVNAPRVPVTSTTTVTVMIGVVPSYPATAETVGASSIGGNGVAKPTKVDTMEPVANSWSTPAPDPTKVAAAAPVAGRIMTPAPAPTKVAAAAPVAVMGVGVKVSSAEQADQLAVLWVHAGLCAVGVDALGL